MKPVHFNALRHVAVPETWIENALAAKPKKRTFWLSPYALGTAAALVAAAAVIIPLLFHAHTPAPLSTQPMVITASESTTAALSAPIGTVVKETYQAATQPSSVAATAGSTAPLPVAAVENTAPSDTAAAQSAPVPPAATSPTVPPDTAPVAALEPWQPFSTEPPEPLEPGVSEPDDPPLTYPPQPVWDGSIEIQIASSSRFFDSSAVYVHLHNSEEDKPVWQIRTPQEQLHFSVVSADRKTAVYPSNGLIRQYDHYHMMVYDRRGQVQDFYFCIRPRANVPDTLAFILE